MVAQRCPCGSGKSGLACCAPVLARTKPAPTAEALMRSRYTAFASAEVDYLLYSWHPATRPATLSLNPAQHWTGLDVLATEAGGLLDTEGVVEFRATYTLDGASETLHEVSQFGRHDTRWVYLSGRFGG